jgi:hypothetical protein
MTVPHFPGRKDALRPAHLAHARQVADAVLYEGYLLYPYRKSAQKNQARFQFGVLVPPGYTDTDPHERAVTQTECLLECTDEATIWVLARFLHLRRRTVQRLGPDGPAEVDSLLVDGTSHTPWDEAADRELEVTASVASLLRGDAEFAVHIDGGQETEDITAADGSVPGRLVHRWEPLDATITVHAERIPGPYGVLLLRVSVANRTVPPRPPAVREDALRHALISAHTLIGADGRFLSMTDPPEWASQMVAGCSNTGTWPVLAGPQECGSLMMSSPIILYDHPEVAPESAGDLFDATEIDEILTLRTLAMTDEEKAEARSTDPRAAGLLDRLDGMPPEMLEKMHGAIRYLAPAVRPVQRGPAEPAEYRTPGEMTDPSASDPSASDPSASDPSASDPSAYDPSASDPSAYDPSEYSVQQPPVPWWDPGADTSVSPETDHVMVGGVRVAKGSRVTMRPGSRRADAQDLFLAGREAVVEAVLFDVDGQVHLAVTPDADPLLADLQRAHGRFLYFSPDEIEPATG